jgi:hypothetical protein
MLRAGTTSSAGDDASQVILVQHFVTELKKLLP